QIVWSETTVAGGASVEVTLPQPQINAGFYRDVAVIAFPAAPAERIPFETTLASVTAGGRTIDPALLSDGNWETALQLAAGETLEIVFREPTTLYGLTAQPTRAGRFPNLQMEASADGETFVAVTRVSSPGRHGIVAPAVRSFETGLVKTIRFTAARDGEVGELVLHRTPRIADWVAKANFDYRVSGQLRQPAAIPSDATIDPARMIDLTAQVRDGVLHWDAPAGAWMVMRFGHTATGKENVAASVAG